MNRRRIILIASAVLAVLIIIFAVIWWVNRDRVVSPVNTNQAIEPGQLPARTRINPEAQLIAPAAGQPQTEATLKAIARTFAERFGSYSSEGNFSNLDDLETLMTTKMQTWANSYITQQSSQQPEGYYGITTTVISTQVVSFDEPAGRAEVQVSTQRQEARGSTINPRTFYQNLNLQLIQAATGWQVDEAAWQ